MDDTLWNSICAEKPTVYILRGVSGIGKSTFTRRIVAASGAACEICSADDYFVNRNTGRYDFDRSRLKEAHAFCKQRFAEALKKRVPLIFLDNTNTQRWHYEPYMDIVQSFNAAAAAGQTAGVLWSDGVVYPGYALRVLEVECPDASVLRRCAERNSHGVSWDILQHQWLDWEEDNTAIKVQPALDPVKDIPLIEAYRSLPEVQEVNRSKARKNGSGPSAKGTPGSTGTGTGRVQQGQGSASVGVSLPPHDGRPAWGSTASGPGRSLLGPGPSSGPSPAGQTGRRRSRAGSSSGALVPGQLPPHMIRRIHYVGLFLTKRSKARLCGMEGIEAGVAPCLPVLLGDHLTVCHSPSAHQLTPQLLDCIGKVVQLSIVAVRTTKFIQAAVVTWPDGLTGSPSMDEWLASSAEGQADMSGLEEREEEMGMEAETADSAGQGPDRDEEEAPVADERDSSEGDDAAPGLHDEMSSSDSCVLAQLPSDIALSNAAVAQALSHVGPSSLSTNLVPHITLSTGHGVPAVTSNRVLSTSNPALCTRVLPPLAVQARVGIAVSARGGLRTYICKPESWHAWVAAVQGRGRQR